MLDCARFRYSALECFGVHGTVVGTWGEQQVHEADTMINNNDYVQEIRLSRFDRTRHDTTIH